MLNRHNLMIYKMTAKDDNRYSLTFVKVERGRTIATDGHRLVEVSRPKIKKGEFPHIKGFPIVESRDFYLDRGTVQKVLRNIPQSNQLPIINNVAVQARKGKPEVKLLTTDLDTNEVITIKQADIKYPDTNSVYPKGKPKVKILLDARYLKEVCDSVIGFSDDYHHPILLEIYDKYEPVKFTATRVDPDQTMRGVIMPRKE